MSLFLFLSYEEEKQKGIKAEQPTTSVEKRMQTEGYLCSAQSAADAERRLL
jgi:hypothetical protein